MRAAVYCGTEDIQVKDVAEPEVGPGDILVCVGYSGICGGDLWIYAGKHPRAKPPLVPGHEVYGRIERVGHDVTAWKEGMRVVLFPAIPCGKCAPCREGNAHVCETLRVIGNDRDGGFTEFVKVQPEHLFAIPDNLLDEQAALVEPLAVGVHAVQNSTFRVGDTALVTGGGPIGNLVAQVLRASGARDVVVSEVKKYRRELAAKMGFAVIDPTAETVEQGLQRTLGSRFADIVFEATGIPAAIQDAIKGCKVRGHISFVGIPKALPQVDILGILFKEIFTSSARMYSRKDYRGAISLLERGAIDVLPLIEKVPLKDAPEAFHKLKAADTSLKILLVP